eukprot:scaffold109506_cov17-Prasinocladus_malaysianus.AAC.2
MPASSAHVEGNDYAVESRSAQVERINAISTARHARMDHLEQLLTTFMTRFEERVGALTARDNAHALKIVPAGTLTGTHRFHVIDR